MRLIRTPRSGLFLAGMAVAVAVAVGVFGPIAPTAHADLPAGAGCPAAAGAGLISYEVSATLPADAGQNANGVCINCNGTGNANNSAVLVANAAGCGATQPTVGAGGSLVWADWETSNCVAPGDTVKIRFKSGTTLPTINSVTWNLADDSNKTGTGVVIGPVGGIAEMPSQAGAGENVGASAGSSGWSAGAYAALAGGLAAALLVGGWYARRRWLR